MVHAAVGKALSNAHGAKVEHWIDMQQADVLTRSAPATSGVLVTNPPYGVRLADQEKLAAFYPKLGDALKARFDGWHAWLFTADLRLAKLIHLKAARRVPLFNGALDGRLFHYPITGTR